MARARKDIAGRHQREGTAVPVSAGVPEGISGSTPVPMLALADLPLHHRDQILDLIRSMARDAARADHAVDRGGGDA